MTVYSVSEITTYLGQILSHDFLLQDLWVSGEVANLSRSGSGHSYFTLRESERSLRCVMFRSANGTKGLVDGAAILAHGRISVYQVRGDLQFIVDVVRPSGMGELQIKLEKLKTKLEKAGLFALSRKRQLPRFPKRLGIITSPSGSVWHDIQSVVSRRYPLVELVLAPTVVQGALSAEQIVQAFILLSEESVDAIILARGGGSLEDLWPFNEENVAYAIFSSPIPVVSAIGHETDVTVADMVADCRAPTPSVAAEMAVPDAAEITAGLITNEQSLSASIFSCIVKWEEHIKQLQSLVDRGLPDLDGLKQRIDDRLTISGTYLIHGLKINSERFQALSHRLTSLSPDVTLQRGYAIVQNQETGKIVLDSAEVESGDLLDITVSVGSMEAKALAHRTKKK